MGEFAPRPKLAAVVPQDIEAWFEGAFGRRAGRGGIVGSGRVRGCQHKKQYVWPLPSTDWFLRIVLLWEDLEPHGWRMKRDYASVILELQEGRCTGKSRLGGENTEE